MVTNGSLNMNSVSDFPELTGSHHETLQHCGENDTLGSHSLHLFYHDDNCFKPYLFRVMCLERRSLWRRPSDSYQLGFLPYWCTTGAESNQTSNIKTYAWHFYSMTNLCSWLNFWKHSMCSRCSMCSMCFLLGARPIKQNMFVRWGIWTPDLTERVRLKLTAFDHSANLTFIFIW